MGDELHAQHLLSDRCCLVGRFRKFDSSALTAATGVDLSLNNSQPTEFFRDLARFLFGKGDLTARHLDAMLRKEPFGLILVNLHERSINRKVLEPALCLRFQSRRPLY